MPTDDKCKFDELCEAAVRNLHTAKTFMDLHDEGVVALSYMKCYRNLQEADRYAEVDLEGILQLFDQVKAAVNENDWQAAKDHTAVIIGHIEAVAQRHKESHEQQGTPKSLTELQRMLQLASWEIPNGTLPN